MAHFEGNHNVALEEDKDMQMVLQTPFISAQPHQQHIPCTQPQNLLSAPYASGSTTSMYSFNHNVYYPEETVSRTYGLNAVSPHDFNIYCQDLPSFQTLLPSHRSFDNMPSQTPSYDQQLPDSLYGFHASNMDLPALELFNYSPNQTKTTPASFQKRATKAPTGILRPCDSRIRQLYVIERKSIEEMMAIINKEFRIEAT